MARIDPSRQVSMVGSSKKIGIGPKDLMRIFVANAEDKMLTKLLPNNIALIIISFFFNSFWVLIAFLSSSDTLFWIKGSDMLVIAVSEEEKNPDKTIKKKIIKI